MTRMARALAGLILLAVWCALWGEVTPANLLSGLAILAVIAASTTNAKSGGRLRLVPLARFLGLACVDLVQSTLWVARRVVTPAQPSDEAIVAVPVPPVSRSHLLMLVVAVTVTPGTAVVDTDPDTGTLYLHLLDHERAETTAAHVDRLAHYARLALPRGVEANPSEAAEEVGS